MADVLNGSPVRPLNDQSTSELVQLAGEQVRQLIRDELALAKAELSEKGKHAGIGIGLFSGGGVLVFYAVGAGIATAIIALDIVWPLWLAALAVTVAIILVAGIAALIGRGQLKKAFPPEPKEAVDGVKADVEEVRNAVRHKDAAQNGSAA